MNNDLISRSELRKAFENHPLINGVWLMYARELIDYAPTVEPFEPDYVGAERLKARQRGYEEGYHNGMKIGKTLNPKIKQGEWIKTDGNSFECSVCHRLFDSDDNYCGYCGADMRGDKE